MLSLRTLGRIPSRVRRSIRVIRLLSNWREAIAAEVGHSALHTLRFRNGVSIDAPPLGQLDFLFHEIWVEQIYTPAAMRSSPGTW